MPKIGLRTSMSKWSLTIARGVKFMLDFLRTIESSRLRLMPRYKNLSKNTQLPESLPPDTVWEEHFPRSEG